MAGAEQGWEHEQDRRLLQALSTPALAAHPKVLQHALIVQAASAGVIVPASRERNGERDLKVSPGQARPPAMQPSCLALLPRFWGTVSACDRTSSRLRKPEPSLPPHLYRRTSRPARCAMRSCSGQEGEDSRATRLRQ